MFCRFLKLINVTGKNAFWSDNEEKRRAEYVTQAKESSEGDNKRTNYLHKHNIEMVEIPGLPCHTVSSSGVNLDCHSIVNKLSVYLTVLNSLFSLQVVRRNVEEEMPRQVGWILNSVFVLFYFIGEFVIEQTLLGRISCLIPVEAMFQSVSFHFRAAINRCHCHPKLGSLMKLSCI